jgi:hypothetical protein
MKYAVGEMGEKETFLVTSLNSHVVILRLGAANSDRVTLSSRVHLFVSCYIKHFET